MEEKPPIRVAYHLAHAEKLDICQLNKVYFEKLGQQIGKSIKIGKILPEQIDPDNCIVQGYVKYQQQSKNIDSYKVDKAVYIMGGHKNEDWSLMQEAMIIG